MIFRNYNKLLHHYFDLQECQKKDHTAILEIKYFLYLNAFGNDSFGDLPTELSTNPRPSPVHESFPHLSSLRRTFEKFQNDLIQPQAKFLELTSKIDSIKTHGTIIHE